MGAAFIEYVERYQRDGATPGAGGLAATVVVTIPVDTLTGGNEPGTLDTGERISPDLARQYACESGIIPVVLNGQGMPLDVGREQRFHTKHQRIAIGLRDRTCTAEGCD